MFTIPIDPDFHLEILHVSHSVQLCALTEKNRNHLREWLPWLDNSKTENDTKSFIKSTMKQYSDDLGFQVALVYRQNIIGITGFHPLNTSSHFGALGYWLSKDHEGHGLMTKANIKIIELGFNKLNLNKVIIQCATENKKSRLVAERMGFKQDGILRQHEWLYDHYVDNVIYSLLKSEFNFS
jgi:ribosomal-protein-serine acetyltransferase